MLFKFYTYSAHTNLDRGMQVFRSTTAATFSKFPKHKLAEVIPPELLTTDTTKHYQPRIATYSDKEIKYYIQSSLLYTVSKCTKDPTWSTIRVFNKRDLTKEDVQKITYNLTPEQTAFFHKCAGSTFIHLKHTIANIAQGIDSEAFIKTQFDAATFASNDLFKQQVSTLLEQKDISKLSFSSKERKSLLEICIENLAYKSSIEPNSKAVQLSIFWRPQLDPLETILASKFPQYLSYSQYSHIEETLASQMQMHIEKIQSKSLLSLSYKNASMLRGEVDKFDTETDTQLAGMREVAYKVQTQYGDKFTKNEMVFSVHKGDNYTKVYLYWQGDLTALECSYCKAVSIQLSDYQINAVSIAILNEFMNEEKSKSFTQKYFM